MYIPFIVYIIVILVAIGLVTSDKFRAFFVAVIIASVLLYGAFAARNAVAEDEIKINYLEEV